MSEPTTPSGQSLARITNLPLRITAIEAEARALLLDELEAAVRELTFRPGLYKGSVVVERPAVLAIFQQHREAIR